VTANGVTLRMTLSEWRHARDLADAWLAYTLPDPEAPVPPQAQAAIDAALHSLLAEVESC
jgi:hypothetical protein